MPATRHTTSHGWFGRIQAYHDQPASGRGQVTWPTPWDEMDLGSGPVLRAWHDLRWRSESARSTSL